MQKGKTQPKMKKKSTGFRLDESLVRDLKIEAIRQGVNPNTLLESWIRQMLQKNKQK
jgi:predicted DNA binding CopG/RHH family protein